MTYLILIFGGMIFGGLCIWLWMKIEIERLECIVNESYRERDRAISLKQDALNRIKALTNTNNSLLSSTYSKNVFLYRVVKDAYCLRQGASAETATKIASMQKDADLLLSEGRL